MRIIIACSRTGGHIFPALSLAKRLKKERKDLEIIFFVPKNRSTQSVLGAEFTPLDSKHLTGFRIKFSSIKNFQSILSLFRLIKESFESFLFLRNFKPDIVIGFGGVTSFGLLLEAKILGIPITIHEQNVIPGRANRMLSYFADRICISFYQTKDYFFKVNRKKVVFTGNPLREEIGTASKQESLRYFDLDYDRFTLLVMGGSQGSHHINSVFLKTLKLLENVDIQIIHITGFRDYKYVRDFYQKTNLKFCVFDFLERMDYAYGAADLVISRAGATAIAEITFLGLPSILIPYPYAYSHQMENALILAKTGAAILIEDKNLEPLYLKKIVFDLKNDKNRLKDMTSKSKDLGAFNGTERLAKEIFSLYS